MLYFSGRLSHIIKFFMYTIFTSIMLIRKDDSHRVRVYHGKAYIDCDVDGDNNSGTCLSDFTVISAFRFNAGYVFGAAFLFAAIIALLEVIQHKRHMFSTLIYYDNVVVNSLITFGVAVIAGTQEASTLILLVLISILYESSIYVHDMGFWGSPSNTSYNHWGRIVVIILFNMITWCVVLAGLIEYWISSASQLPIFVPMLGMVGMAHMLMVRIFHYRYFYGMIPYKIRHASVVETTRLFDDKFDSGINKYDLVVKHDPYVVDWGDSWKNILNVSFRFIVGTIFIVGTNNVKIIYR